MRNSVTPDRFRRSVFLMWWLTELRSIGQTMT